MSSGSLRSQLKEHYLTCTICFGDFIKPKALPCIHTFCQECLRDYIVSRGYENVGSFPCPVCRKDTALPNGGVEGFQDNHLMSSLSDTVEAVDKSAGIKPTPKPRRSLGQPQVQSSQLQESDEIGSCKEDNSGGSTSPSFSFSDTCPKINKTDLPSSSKLGLNDDISLSAVHRCGQESQSEAVGSSTNKDDRTVCPSQLYNQLPTSSSSYTGYTSEQLYNFPPALANHNQHVYPAVGEAVTQPSPIGWNLSKINDVSPNLEKTGNFPKAFRNEDLTGNIMPFKSSSSQTLYPTVPSQTEHSNTACSDNLLLKFGKQGSSVRDFIKPVGLAVSKEGSFVVSDSSGGVNRIFIFNSEGTLITAFNCGCKVQDITMTKNNEILAAVKKTSSAIRRFTLAGQLKAEYGKFFTYEEPWGIGELKNGGVALSGTQNHCIYVLTEQMKLANKFGRKGNGEGYFQHPGCLAVDSKNHIVVTDKINNCVQVFQSDGKCKLRFGDTGSSHGQLQAPLGVCVDDSDNIIVADSGNHRVEVFSTGGHWLSSVVTNTQKIGSEVKPVNVAFTPTGCVAVLLRGPYFAEVRVYSPQHKQLAQDGRVSSPPFGLLNFFNN